MSGKLQSNESHDINQLPKEWGIIVFPISMSRIANTQSPQACIEALDAFVPKITANHVGAHFLYSEGLYMNLAQDAWKTKNSFAQTMVAHMRGMKRLIAKNFKKYQIESAFSFSSWFQMYLYHSSFFNALKTVEDTYATDEAFRHEVARDAAEQQKELTPQQLAFYLEEHTFMYLFMNRQLEIVNVFVNHRETWVLLAYPGRPPRGQIYLYQKDPLHLNKDTNPYKGQYDLEARKFIDYGKIDLTNY